MEEVVAGLRVRGNAQTPELTVFSDPPMSQANALSYLVAGKPIDDIGSGEGDGDAVQTATRSLGAAAVVCWRRISAGVSASTSSR